MSCDLTWLLLKPGRLPVPARRPPGPGGHHARIAATGLPARVADQMKRFDIEAHGPGPARRRRQYLPAALTAIMCDVGIPNGIGGVGYDEDDAAAILSRSLSNW